MSTAALLTHSPVKLADMVDLALGTPEVGAVNFNVLHTLLHAILSRLNIADSVTEIPEDDRRELTSAGTTGAKKAATPGEEDGRESVLTVDSGLTDMHSKGPKSASTTAGPPTSATPDGRHIVLRMPYHALQERMSLMEKQLEALNSLPNNRDLMADMLGGITDKQQRIVSDMWQMVSNKKRIDANEEGISRLSSLMDDMMKEMAKLTEENAKLRNQITNMSDMSKLLDRISDLEKQLQALKEHCDSALRQFGERLDKYPDPENLTNLVTWDALESALRGLKEEMDKLKVPPPERVVINMATDPISRPVSARSVASPGPSAALQEMLENLGALSHKHDALEVRVVKLEEEMPNKADKKDLENLKLPSDLLQSIQDMRTQMDALMNLRNRDNEAMARIREALNHLQNQMENLNNLVQKLMEDSRNSLDRIEKLFHITTDHEGRKADISYVDSKVEPKADLTLLEGKVNFSLFDETTGNLHKLIADVLKKLLDAEEELRRLLAELGGGLDGKLDRGELDALREWLEKRLRALAAKMKGTGGALPETDDDAAGLRRQLLQHFHCISCDRPLDVMPTGPFPAIPEKPGLAPNRSLRPYTVFELESIRQQAKNVGTEIIDLYQTPRPCGGTHTLTHPHKRVNKMSANYAFEDENYEAVPVPQPPRFPKEEVDIQGVDGHIYKGRLNQRTPGFYQQQAADDDKLPPVRTALKPDGQELPKSARTAPVKPKQVTRFADRDGIVTPAGGQKPSVAGVATPPGMHHAPPPSSVITVEDRGLADLSEDNIGDVGGARGTPVAQFEPPIATSGQPSRSNASSRSSNKSLNNTPQAVRPTSAGVTREEQEEEHFQEGGADAEDGGDTDRVANEITDEYLVAASVDGME